VNHERPSSKVVARSAFMIPSNERRERSEPTAPPYRQVCGNSHPRSRSRAPRCRPGRGQRGPRGRSRLSRLAPSGDSARSAKCSDCPPARAVDRPPSAIPSEAKRSPRGGRRSCSEADPLPVANPERRQCPAASAPRCRSWAVARVRGSVLPAHVEGKPARAGGDGRLAPWVYHLNAIGLQR
jgi:hypothetical protein